MYPRNGNLKGLRISAIGGNCNAPALNETRRSANQGDAGAQFNLGLMYFQGEGVAKNKREAMKWFRKAADQGDPDAQFNVGYMYNHGEGVRKNIAAAMEWYEKAASQGHSAAQNDLGLIYGNRIVDGEGSPAGNEAAARYYFSRAAA